MFQLMVYDDDDDDDPLYAIHDSQKNDAVN